MNLERLALMPARDRSIRLDTHRGRPITNVVAPAITERERRLYTSIRARYGSRWQPRKDACGVYNCFGHVFASRRAAIYQVEEIDGKVRPDDGYRVISWEHARVGDVAVYRDRRDRKDIHHVGLIVSVAYEPDRHRLPQIWVLSKWNDVTGEDVHLINDVQHLSKAFELQIEVWSDCADEGLS